MSTILISNGKLKKGDFFICGDTWGKIRAMINYEGKNIDDGIEIKSKGIKATYNGPFTIPILRRNEAMFKINIK